MENQENTYKETKTTQAKKTEKKFSVQEIINIKGLNSREQYVLNHRIKSGTYSNDKKNQKQWEDILNKENLRKSK